jgi:hypothetical protein
MVFELVPFLELPETLADRVVLLISKMVGQFSVESALDQSLGELLKQPVLAE